MGRQLTFLKGLSFIPRSSMLRNRRKLLNVFTIYSVWVGKGSLESVHIQSKKKWMCGKGGVTIQFGCCYNYTMDKNGNPPSIIRDEEVDPLPPLFKQMIKCMVKWFVLPPTCIPNSCIVNIYDEGDCIPPHIDHHDFLRPFSIISFLTKCSILFDANFKVVDAGEFSGPVSIPLPYGYAFCIFSPTIYSSYIICVDGWFLVYCLYLL